jgi:hypothetical protein
MIGKVPEHSNLRRLHRVVTGQPDGGANLMERRVLRLTPAEASIRARLVLAARLRPVSLPVPHVAGKDEPESIMTISFEGLTEREQEAALAAFPGGKRFVLAN